VPAGLILVEAQRRVKREISLRSAIKTTRIRPNRANLLVSVQSCRVRHYTTHITDSQPFTQWPVAHWIYGKTVILGSGVHRRFSKSSRWPSRCRVESPTARRGPLGGGPSRLTGTRPPFPFTRTAWPSRCRISRWDFILINGEQSL